MTRKRRAYLYVIILPFVVSAAFEFLDAWLYWPICLLSVMSWLGACCILAEKEQS
jgi:hypothetical protein